MAHLTDKVLKGFEEGLLTRTILIDFRKAFDAINYEPLLQKLNTIRLSEQNIQWFRSYVCNWMFLLETGNKLSDLGKISCGVLHGSILGLLLILVYVDDMPQAVKSSLLSYPDDLCLMYQHKDIPIIEKILNEDLENICECLLITNYLFISEIIKLIQF